MREIKIKNFDTTIQIIGKNEDKNIAEIYEKICYDSISQCIDYFKTISEIVIFVIKCNINMNVQCNDNINIAKYLLSNDNLIVNIFDHRKLGYRC